jgi:hypothetical protein
MTLLLCNIECGESQEPQKIVVLWSEGSIEDLTNSLTSLTPRGSEVTVISKKEPEVAPAFHRTPPSVGSHNDNALIKGGLMPSKGEITCSVRGNTPVAHASQYETGFRQA